MSIQDEIKTPIRVPSVARDAQVAAEQGVDREEVARFGDRLGGELMGLLNLVPVQHLSAAGLCRWLGMNRGTCQRILQCARAVGDGLEVVRRAPGVEGVDEFVRGMVTRLGRRPEVDRAEAMVQEYARLVLRAGGSQTKLVRLGAWEDAGAIGMAAVMPHADQVLDARRSIYESSRVTTGMWSEANVAVQVFRPSLSDPAMLDETHARGYIGVRRRAGGLALYSRLLGTSNPGEMTTLEGERGEGRQWSALLAEFCTEPLPTVVSQVEPDADAVSWIMLGDGAVERPVDVVLGGRSTASHPDPRSDSITHLCATVGLRFPSRAQVYDLYLHRDLARGAQVLSHALARHPVEADPVQNWFDKLAYTPKLTELGQGLAPESFAAYPRVRELAAHVFGRVGWDPAEFEVWRMELEYPTPGMFYSISVHPRR